MVENLSQYKYFYEAAKAGSISAAAKKMFVTQPAVSSMISALEEELGVKLFFRTGRGIALTPEGELLFGSVRSAFSFLEAGEDKLREISGLSGGTLRIGASDMTLRFFLLDYIAGFKSDFPKVKLTVTNAPTPLTLEALKCGQIDLCVISEPVRTDCEIESIPVKTIRDIFVANEKFSARGRVLNFNELSEFPLIMLERNTSTRRFVEAHFTSCGVPEGLIEPAIELATSDLVLEFARRGIGIGCIVEDFAKEAISSGELYEIMLKEPMPQRHFRLAYLKDLPLSAAAKEFVSRIRPVD